MAEASIIGYFGKSLRSRACCSRLTLLSWITQGRVNGFDLFHDGVEHGIRFLIYLGYVLLRFVEMLEVLSLIYGALMIALVYGVSYLSVRGVMGKGAVPFFLILAKYFIYWKAIVYGFKTFSTPWILMGFVCGVYLSLPLLYYFNKKQSFSQ
jgi:hypothetical protein